MLVVLTGQQGSPRVSGLKRTLSLGETWPIFHSWVDVMVQGHTKPPRLGPSNMSATGMSPARALGIQICQQLWPVCSQCLMPVMSQSTQPPRLGASTLSATSMSPACPLTARAVVFARPSKAD